jgi:toxin ParE1/3/4
MNLLPLVFLDEAGAEFDEAAAWYEEKKAGLGVDFVARIQEALDRIASMPRVHPVIHENVRRAIAKKFPYIVYYEVEADQIVVVPVFHSSRDPSAWNTRVP